MVFDVRAIPLAMLRPADWNAARGPVQPAEGTARRFALVIGGAVALQPQHGNVLANLLRESPGSDLAL